MHPRRREAPQRIIRPQQVATALVREARGGQTACMLDETASPPDRGDVKEQQGEGAVRRGVDQGDGPQIRSGPDDVEDCSRRADPQYLTGDQAIEREHSSGSDRSRRASQCGQPGARKDTADGGHCANTLPGRPRSPCWKQMRQRLDQVARDARAGSGRGSTATTLFNGATKPVRHE